VVGDSGRNKKGAVALPMETEREIDIFDVGKKVLIKKSSFKDNFFVVDNSGSRRTPD